MAKKPIKKKPQQKVAPAEKKSKVDPKSTVDNTSGALIDCLAGDKKVTKLSTPTLFKIDVEDDGGAIQDPLTKLLQPFGNRDLSSTKITNTSSITDVDAKFSSIAFKLSSRIDMIDGGLANLNKKFDSAIGQLNKKYEAEHKSSVQNYRKLEAQLSDIKQPTYSRGGLETKGGQKITGGGARLPLSGTDLAAMALLVFPHLKKNYLDPFFAKYDKEIGNLTNSIADNRAAVEAARKAARMTSGAVTASRTVAKGVGAAVQAVTPAPKTPAPTPKTYGTSGTTTSFTGAPRTTPVPIKQPLKTKSLTAAITKRLGRAAFGVLLRNLPVVGLGLAMIDAGVRIGRGDKQGAALAAGSGVTGLIPLLGTVTSLGFNAVLVSHDIFRDVHGRDPIFTNQEDLDEIGRILQAMGTFTKAKEAYIKEEISKSNNQALRQSDEKTFMAAMAKTGQMRRGQYTGMEMDEQVASTTKGGYLFGMIGGTKVPGKTITLDQNRQVPAYDMNMGRMNLGARGVPGTAAGSSNYMAQFAGSAGITTPPLPMQRQMAMMPPLPTMKPQPLSFASNSFRERVYQQKSQFMQFGALPGGFENVMGNRGILGKPVMVAASGAQPFGGGFSGGSGSSGGGGPAYSGVPGGSGPLNSTIVNPKTGNLTNASSEYTPVGFGENITVDKRGNVNKTEMRNYLIKRIASSKLNGYVPPDGKENGILKGAPEEWANYYMRLGMVESSLKVTTHGDKGRFGGHGSRGLFQLSPADAINHSIQKKPFSYEQLADPKTNIDAAIAISENVMLGDGKKWKGRGSIRRGMGRYWGPVRRGWTPGGTKRDAQMFANNKDAWQRQDTARAEAGAVESELDVNSTAFRTPGTPKSEMGLGYDDFGPSAGTARAGVMPDDIGVTKVAPGTPDTSMTDPLTGRLGVGKMNLGAPGSGVEQKSEARPDLGSFRQAATLNMNNSVNVLRKKEAADRIEAGPANFKLERRTRRQMRQQGERFGRKPGNRSVFLDFNAPRSGIAKGFLIVVPDDATPEEIKRTKEYRDGYLKLMGKHGGSRKTHGNGKHGPGILTTRENKNGVKGTFHLEDGFNTDPSFKRLMGDPTFIKDLTRLRATTLGKIKGVTFQTPHGDKNKGRDRGAVITITDPKTGKRRTISERDHALEYGLPALQQAQEEMREAQVASEREKGDLDPNSMFYAQDKLAQMRQSGEVPTMVQPSESDSMDIGATPTVSAPTMVEPSQSDPLDIGATPTVSAPTMVEPSQSDPLDIGATPTVKAPEPPPPTNDAKSAILDMGDSEAKAEINTRAADVKRDDEAKKAKDGDSKNSSRTRAAGGRGGSGQHHPEQEAPRAGSSGYGASGRCWV